MREEAIRNNQRTNLSRFFGGNVDVVGLNVELNFRHLMLALLYIVQYRALCKVGRPVTMST